MESLDCQDHRTISGAHFSPKYCTMESAGLAVISFEALDCKLPVPWLRSPMYSFPVRAAESDVAVSTVLERKHYASALPIGASLRQPRLVIGPSSQLIAPSSPRNRSLSLTSSHCIEHIDLIAQVVQS